MSQASSQVQDPSWVSLPFEKYSYNNSRIGTRRYTWSHIGPRNDLDFVIRNVRVVDEQGNYINRVVMKISAGADILVCPCTFPRPETTRLTVLLRKLRTLES